MLHRHGHIKTDTTQPDSFAHKIF